MKSIAKKSLEMTGLFEAEIFVWLLLKAWEHPVADDKDFQTDLLENAAEALRAASAGHQMIQGLPARDMNFIAAIWYAETCSLEAGGGDLPNVEARKDWLASVRRTLPSCFCDPSNLGPS